MSNIAVLGSGQVGQVLADGFLAQGYSVMRASREPIKLAAWKTGAGAKAHVGTFAEAATWGDWVVLAVKGAAAEAVVDQAGPQNLAGKVVMDTTNPIADAPPQNGVLRFFTDLNESLMERLQRKAPAARFVKAFSCVGSLYMVNPSLPGGPPTMFICRNDAAAKEDVKTILDQFGWDTADMGSAEAARAIEPLCILWCIPGLRQNSWTHALKLLRAS
ncbi:MAG TPA: NAD(P)-binding domain-containing protein [Polyangiaceae bacterium]|jgi:predicted dinucleotide-binding enzyme|nr:NAD(P)-binding domain-containing protein [Polyangiaceae bacterium]